MSPQQQLGLPRRAAEPRCYLIYSIFLHLCTRESTRWDRSLLTVLPRTQLGRQPLSAGCACLSRHRPMDYPHNDRYQTVYISDMSAKGRHSAMKAGGAHSRTSPSARHLPASTENTQLSFKIGAQTITIQPKCLPLFGAINCGSWEMRVAQAHTAVRAWVAHQLPCYLSLRYNSVFEVGLIIGCLHCWGKFRRRGKFGAELIGVRVGARHRGS